MASQLTEIDELLAQDHRWVQPGEDEVYFLREYTSHVGYGYSATNSLINNLKKPPSVRGTSQWQFKAPAIRQVAGEFIDSLNPEWLEEATLVPIPPSKAEDHPEYDDRMLQVVEEMRRIAKRKLDLELDVRPLLRQRQSVEAAHEGGPRLRPHELEELFEIDERYSDPPPQSIGVIDDVLTTGAHFVAAKRVLSARFEGVEVAGFFVARRVFPEDG